MRVCAISSKECWRTPGGRWFSYGGFPLQMGAIAEVFGTMTLLIAEVAPRSSGIPLPEVEIVPMREPRGRNTLRKADVFFHTNYYVDIMRRHIGRADVVHVPLPGDLPLVGLAVAAAMRKPIIARYCGAWDRNAETTVMNRVTRSAMRWLARGNNVMLATGMGEMPPAPGMDWIFASVLSQREVANLSADLDRGLSEPAHLGFVGRLSPEKGILDLLEALSLLRQRRTFSMPRLSIIGDGPLRTAVESEIRRHGLAGHVRLTGQLDRHDLSRELSDIDICVQPSRSESLCKAWIDALGHGVPVLVTEVGAARAFIGDCGWLVPPACVPRLADALDYVLTAPLNWPALRHRCADKIRGMTLENWAARIAEITESRLGMPLHAPAERSQTA